MSVSNINNNEVTSNGGTQNSGAPQSNGGGINDMFLTLLVAQIQNQDPTNPTDGTEYVNQLAQMSQMESMNNLSTMMTNIGYLVDNIQLLSTASLVGQQVYVEGNQLQLEQDQKVDGRLTLAHAANTVTLHIKDETGNETTLELGKQDAGDVDFTVDAEKLGLKPGKYTLSVVTDTGETQVSTQIAGTVNSVRIDSATGKTLLTIPGVGEVDYTQLRQFGNTKTPAPQRAQPVLAPQSRAVV